MQDLLTASLRAKGGGGGWDGWINEKTVSFCFSFCSVLASFMHSQNLSVDRLQRIQMYLF